MTNLNCRNFASGAESWINTALVVCGVLMFAVTAPEICLAQDSLFTADPAWSSGPANSTNSVALGDVDGDGDLDLVCGNFSGSNKLNLYLNNGGTFSTLPAWSSGPANATFGVALGDVDGDGDLDLVCGTAGRTTLYLNTGGTFSALPAWSSGPVTGTRSVALGDVDGDGDLDLVCGTAGQNTLYLNTGGMFSTQPAWSSGPETLTLSVALGDVDGDGYLDLVCGNGASNTLYLNTGGTLSTQPAWSSGPANRTAGVVLGDVDGDGDLDLVCANTNVGGSNSGQSNTLYLNTAGTLSTQPAWSSGPVNHTQSVALGDVDGDGDLDLVCGNGVSLTPESNTLYLNTGGTFSTLPAWSPGRANLTQSVALGDVDGDGDLDLICGNGWLGLDRSNTLYLKMGGTFPALPAWSSGPANGTRSVALGDVDGDGDLDLVCGNSPGDIGQSNTLYLNTERTFSALPAWSSGPANATLGVALGDVDGDGDLDLVCGNIGSNTLYLNTGGTFSAQPVWSSGPANFTKSVALGDVDGDGDLDLVCGNDGGSFFTPESNTLYLNTGGTFSAQPAWTSGPAIRTQSVALGDVDGDGDLDLVCGNALRSNPLYLNTGGTFSTQPAWTSGPVNWTYSVILGDVDGDGDLDLICGNGNSNEPESNTLYLNTGGTFSAQPAWSSGPANSTNGVALGDVDGDGDLDLACGNEIQSNTLYLNTGGTFETATDWSSDPTKNTRSVALGDVDGDGDLDLVCGNGGQSNALYEGKKDPVFKGDPLLPTNHLPNNSVHLGFAKLGRPDVNTIRIHFNAIDVESDPVLILPEYQFEGDPTWFPVEVAGQTGSMGPFPATPGGVADSIEWNISRFPFDNRNVILRLRTIEIPARVSFIRHVASYQKHVGPIVPSRPELTASADSLSFATVTVGDTVSLNILISNTGNLDLVISNIGLPSTEMEIRRSTPFSITPGDTDTLSVFLEPRTELDISGNLLISSDDPITPVESIAVTTDIRALEIQSQLLTPAPEVPLGQAVAVIVTPAPFVNVERGDLISRPADSTLVFGDTIPLFLSGNVFSAVIPGSLVTEAGLHYYIEVENSGVLATDPGGAPVQFFVQSVQPPVAISANPRPNSGSDYLEGREISVQVGLPEGTNFIGGALHYRPGGEISYQVDSLVVGEIAPEATIPDTTVGPRGVEFWVEVQTQTRFLRDPSVNWTDKPRTLQATVQNLEETKIHPAEQYRMVSIPLEFDVSFTETIEALLSDQAAFGPYDTIKWRSFRYAPELSKYVELSNENEADRFRPRPGRAFWLISRARHRVNSAPITGRSTQTDRPFEITLAPGWNQVGNPYVFPVAWDSLGVDTLTMAEADTLVQGPVGWSAGGGFQFDVQNLEPFNGYWVNNLTVSPLVLKVPPIEAPGAQALVASKRPAAGEAKLASGASLMPPSDDWRIQISVSSSGANDRQNYVGIRTDATSQWDRRDRHEPPLIPGKALSLYFPHFGWKRHPGPYAFDIRGDYEELGEKVGALGSVGEGVWGHVWRFDVTKNFSDESAGDEVSVEFVGIEGVPHEAMVLLIDTQLNHLIDLRKVNSYRFFQGKRPLVTEEKNARFVLLVGSEAFVTAKGDGLSKLPTRTVLHQNHPNPFNPATVIRYDVATPGKVSVKIYNVSGALVKTLEDRHRERGRYEVGWNGDNNHGQKVASGIYFYRLSAVGFMQTRKMVFLK